MFRAIGNHDHGRANSPTGVVSPLDAAALGTQSVDGAAGAADENLPVEKRRKRQRVDVAFVPEGPLQLQVPHLVDGQPSDVGRLETSVIALRAPAVPDEFGLVVDGDSAVLAERAGGQDGLAS